MSGDVEGYNAGHYNHFVGTREAMLETQLEKERIQRAILEEEALARRRELEAEVRREMWEERELEWRRRGGDPITTCYVERGLFDKRVTLPVGERMCGFPRLEEGKNLRERMYDYPRLEEGTIVRGRINDYRPLEKGRVRGYVKFLN